MNVPALIALAQKYAAEIQKIAPHNWKGNEDGQTHHFDAGSISAQVGVDALAQKVTVDFKYTDAGTPHEISAVVPIAEVGKRGPDEVVTVDGAATTSGAFVVGTRWGIDHTGFYHRLIVEFRFTDAAGKSHTVRFDGDL
jgi:hypothetical protein